MAGGDDELRIYVEKLAQALQHNMPPPPIPADMPAGAVSEIDMLLAGLGMAGNSGDPKDMAQRPSRICQARREDRRRDGEIPCGRPGFEQATRAADEFRHADAPTVHASLRRNVPGALARDEPGYAAGHADGHADGEQHGQSGQGAGLAGELPADALGDALGAGGAALGAGGGGGAGAGRRHNPGRKPWAATDSVSRHLSGLVANRSRCRPVHPIRPRERGARWAAECR